MKPPDPLDRRRAIDALRRLVSERGPDAGRRIDHLKQRASDGLAAVWAGGAAPFAHVVELTRADGNATLLLHLIGLSAVDGADVVE